MSCTLCMNLMATTSNNMASLKCGHLFHLTCVIRRLSVIPNCPTCYKKASVADVTQLTALPSKKVPETVAASPKTSNAKPFAFKMVERLREKLAVQAEKIEKLLQEKARLEKKVAAAARKNAALERTVNVLEERVETVAKERNVTVQVVCSRCCRALTRAGQQCSFKLQGARRGILRDPRRYRCRPRSGSREDDVQENGACCCCWPEFDQEGRTEVLLRLPR